MNTKRRIRFEDYLSCAYIGFGLSTVLTYIFTYFVYNVDLVPLSLGVVLLPPIISGFVSGFFLGQKVSFDFIFDGLKCSLSASIFTLLIGSVFFSDISGGLWIIIGFFIGTYLGLYIGSSQSRTSESPLQ